MNKNFLALKRLKKKCSKKEQKIVVKSNTATLPTCYELAKKFDGCYAD